MPKLRALVAASVLSALLAACAPWPNRPLVDPVTVRFPLDEAGALDVKGTIVGQPRARSGIIYFATREGFLTAVVAPARRVFWRFKAEHPLSVGPELSEEHILLRDDRHVLYVIDFKGVILSTKVLEGVVTTAVREKRGRIFFGTEDGMIRALEALSAPAGRPLWEYGTSGPVTAGPVFAGNLVLFGTADGRLLALDFMGRLVWTFGARGPLSADPAAFGNHVYFGTADNFFYDLDGRTGKMRWTRSLQGAPLHPALGHGSRLAVAASNSVIYILSRKGGSILFWEPVPSRIVLAPSLAGPALVVSSAAPRLSAHDIETGKVLGEQVVSGPQMAGALWVSPWIVCFEGDDASGRQRIVFLEHRAKAPLAGQKKG